MAITALHSAATGMRALDTHLDVLANNLANVNTAGFKRSRTNFEDLMYQVRREPGLPNAQSEPTPHGIQVGLGVKTAGTQLDFSEGGTEQTDRRLDVYIDGDGFFQVTTIDNGQTVTAYTRYGAFVRNAEGNLTLANSIGSLVEPQINISPDASDITIAPNGEVSVREAGAPELTVSGTIELARFVNPEGLKQIGNNLYIETPASGPPVVGAAQEDGFGATIQGGLEQSNVDPVMELIGLIKTQRAFEMNSQSIQAADQALQVVSNLALR
jgi:flagellar basal-body rod protein FlgG